MDVECEGFFALELLLFSLSFEFFHKIWNFFIKLCFFPSLNQVAAVQES